jgi:acyl dehydratase
MALNLDMLGAQLGPFLHRWDSKDAILYALSVGAGPSELAFTTENTQGITQKLLPTFSVIGCGPEAIDIWDKIGTFDHSQLLHLEQSISLAADLPPSAEVETTASVEGIYDRIIGASVEVRFTTRDVCTAKVLFETESTVIIRGEGGFGGPRGSRAKVPNAPERDPDAVITYETQPGQALLYRLNGDRNPLHSDPEFARAAGFERPILHGLCTYGFAGRALLSATCDNESEKFGSMSARFVAPVYPGDLLTTAIWRSDEGAAFLVENQCGVTVLDRGSFTYRGV